MPQMLSQSNRTASAGGYSPLSAFPTTNLSLLVDQAVRHDQLVADHPDVTNTAGSGGTGSELRR